MRILASAAGALVVLALPSGAGAAETVGAKLPLADLADYCTGTPIGLVHDALPASAQAPGGLKADSHGVITRWRIETTAGADHFPIALRIYDRTGADTYIAGAISALETIYNPPLFGRINQFDTRLTIEVGQEIGLDAFMSGAACFKLGVTDCDHAVNQLQPPLIVGAPGTATFNNRCLPLNADIEPDADRDGFGDETQDACPSAPSTQVPPCPAVAGPPCTGLKAKARKRCLCKRKKAKARKKCLKRLKAKPGRLSSAARA